MSARIFEKSITLKPDSDRYSNTRAFEDIHIAVGGNRNTIFLEFVHDHLDNFVAVLQFLFRR